MHLIDVRVNVACPSRSAKTRRSFACGSAIEHVPSFCVQLSKWRTKKFVNYRRKQSHLQQQQCTIFVDFHEGKHTQNWGFLLKYSKGGKSFSFPMSAKVMQVGAANSYMQNSLFSWDDGNFIRRNFSSSSSILTHKRVLFRQFVIIRMMFSSRSRNHFHQVRDAWLVNIGQNEKRFIKSVNNYNYSCNVKFCSLYCWYKTCTKDLFWCLLNFDRKSLATFNNLWIFKEH